MAKAPRQNEHIDGTKPLSRVRTRGTLPLPLEMIYLCDDFDAPQDESTVLDGFCVGYRACRRRSQRLMSPNTPSVERTLYEAVIAFCDDRGIQLNRGPMADLIIPAGVNVQYRVPIAALQDAP